MLIKGESLINVDTMVTCSAIPLLLILFQRIDFNMLGEYCKCFAKDVYDFIEQGVGSGPLE